MNTRMIAAGVLVVSGLAAGACSPQNENPSSAPSTQAVTTTAAATGHGHDHPLDGGAAPSSMQVAKNPRYAVGSSVMLTADHMPGMSGATATISGAYDTIAYQVDYQPTTGGDPVTNHKWVVAEELVGATADQPLAVGATAMMDAAHMPGMSGATATISGMDRTTVYMVDFTHDGTTYTRHKWVTEDEIAGPA